MTGLIRTYRNFSRGGTDPDFSRILINKIMIINVTLLIEIPSTILFAIFYYYMGLNTSGLISLIATAVYGIALVFNQRGKIDISRFLVLFPAIFVVSYSDISLGGQTGVHLFLLTITVAVFILYDTKEWLLITFYIITVLLAHSAIANAPLIVDPIILNSNEYNLLNTIAYFSNLVLILVFVMLVMYCNHELTQKLHSLITRYKRLNQNEKELKKLSDTENQQLVEFIRNKDRFLNLVSQDIQSPVESIKDISDKIISKENDLNKNELIEYADRLNNCSSQLLSVADNFMKWAGYISGQTPISPESVNLYGLLKKVTNELEAKIKQTWVKFNIDIPMNIHFESDPYLVTYIFKNLAEVSLNKASQKNI